MDAAAPINPPDETQIENAASTFRNILNAFGFHVLVTLLGIVRALM
jgi:hypothetical protein